MGEPFDEAEAARRLSVSKATLARVRLAGQIHPMRIGPRVIRYTDIILDEYRTRCPDDLDDLLEMASLCRTPLVREPGVYLLYVGDEVIYVGKTTNFSSRLASHMFRKVFDSYAFLRADLGRIDALEARLIDKLRPRLNTALNQDNPTKRRTGHGCR